MKFYTFLYNNSNYIPAYSYTVGREQVDYTEGDNHFEVSKVQS